MRYRPHGLHRLCLTRDLCPVFCERIGALKFLQTAVCLGLCAAGFLELLVRFDLGAAGDFRLFGSLCLCLAGGGGFLCRDELRLIGELADITCLPRRFFLGTAGEICVLLLFLAHLGAYLRGILEVADRTFLYMICDLRTAVSANHSDTPFTAKSFWGLFPREPDRKKH